MVKMRNGWNLVVEGTRSEKYLINYVPGQRGEFVARFKYMRPGAACNRFAAFLVRNFTPAEYFAALALNGRPLDILKAKGFDPLTPKQRAAADRMVAEWRERNRVECEKPVPYGC
jgi:hypothetical protein